jgi:hypothetical protein
MFPRVKGKSTCLITDGKSDDSSLPAHFPQDTDDTPGVLLLSHSHTPLERLKCVGGANCDLLNSGNSVCGQQTALAALPLAPTVSSVRVGRVA